MNVNRLIIDENSLYKYFNESKSHELVESEFESFSNEDIKQFLMGLGSIILKDFPRKSRLTIMKMIDFLYKHHPNELISHLRLAFVGLAKILMSSHGLNNPSIDYGSSCQLSLEIIISILSRQSIHLDTNNDSIKHLLQLVIVLSSGCFLSGRRKSIKACRKSIGDFLAIESIVTEQLIDIIESSEPKIPFFSFLILMPADRSRKINRKSMIEYVKLCFNDKSIVPVNLIGQLRPVIDRAIETKSDFVENLLPLVTRMSLRSPEKFLSTVRIVLQSISRRIDLSAESGELAKLFSLQLQSKTESIRADSAECLLQIVQLSSESDAVKSIFSRLESLLNQSGVDVKLDIWRVIGRIPARVAVGSAQTNESIAEFALDRLTVLISKETQDAFISAGLDAVSEWAKLSIDRVPPNLLAWFGKSIFQSKLSPVSRASHFQSINNCFDRPQKLIGLKSLLGSSDCQDWADRLAAASMTTAAMIESAPMIELILRYFSFDSIDNWELLKSNPLFGSIWSIIGLKSNPANNKLFSDQLLVSIANSTATTGHKSSLKFIIGISECVLSTFFQLTSSSNYVSIVIRCLSIMCLHPDYRSVRKPALDTVARLARSINGEQIIAGVLDHVSSLDLSTDQSIWTPSSTDDPESIDGDRVAVCVQKLGAMIDSVLAPLSSSPAEWCDDDCRVRLMSRALFAVNRRALVSHHNGARLWAKHASRALVVPLIEKDTAVEQDIIDRIIVSGPGTCPPELDANQRAVLECLCRNFSNRFINRLMGAVLENLRDDKLFRCTETDAGIMNTRDGYLYNRLLLDSLPKYESQKTNIKRENKMYSYKDQMAEIEMRKEIEKKKQNKSNSIQSEADDDNPIKRLASQLTKNQMEQVNLELEKERTIRNRMKELENRANLMCDILETISNLKQNCFLSYFDGVLSVLKKLIIESPVARFRAALLFNKLRILTTWTQKQAMWVLRVIFLDSSVFNEELIENWKYNKNGQRLMELIKPWMNESLDTWSANVINANSKQASLKKFLDFPSFLYLLPAYCHLGLSIADMECPDIGSKDPQWWCYLTWMDIELLKDVLNTIYMQVCAGDINKKQLFNIDLMAVLVKIIQNSEIPDVQLLVENIVLVMMKMLNEDESFITFDIFERNVFKNLMNCFISNTIQARILTLDSLNTIDQSLLNGFFDQLSLYIWIAKHDVDKTVVEKAEDLWNKLSLCVDNELVFKLQDFVILPHDHIMTGSISGVTALIEMDDDQLDPLVRNILQLYEEFAYLKPPVCDAFGRVLIASPPDQWQARHGLSKTLLSLSKFISESSLVESLFNFLIPRALSDRNQQVRHGMLETGQKVIEYSGKQHINMLLPIMENYLSSAENVAENDIIRQSIVILMGSLAKHLDASDERFINIFGKLIAALNFPSADVQRSVSDTFDPLVKAFDEERQREICNSLLQVLLNSNQEAERKGAAYGLAGIIKAVGITKLKSFKIHDALIEAIQNKQNEKHREIALFTFEQISAKMNKMFEPYVPGILKYLQDTFADPSNLVRQTADKTAKVLMSNLSAPGVKIVLNPLLAGLDTNQWRTKSVSVELLGSMAHCAPKQLSNCLPTIVPKILSILSDSHPNVIKAGHQALREIGSVIHNKEVQVIVPILIDALCEPNKKTNEGLNALIETKFIHQVDAASLALIMSMVARAFKERRSDTKRKAAQIIGNLHSLTDDKDLQPYCSSLLPGLKSCLVDPDPTVRTVASKALGTIAKVMTSSVYEELMCWLMDTLKDETSGVNRSGAAQGLSEVLMHKGISHLEKFMPDILENSRNQKLLAHVRDGYLMLYIYLPRLFREQFACYVESILPPILQALSDEVEFIRDTALNAGQGIIDIYSHIAIDTMLPNLELGMFDCNWRIRYSSIKLLGDLLFRLTGISGKGTTTGVTEDESFAHSKSQDILVENLGQDTYSRVLAKIYICRMDIALLVKQAATHIWKLMVVNTARTLRWIMKDLLEIILNCLSDSNDDSRIMCTKSLGDVVKKLGERILPDIFTHLESGFEKCKSGQRMGICTAISEILKASPRDQIGNYLDKILPTFKNCMIDENENVRQMAGEIFDLLNTAIGVKIVDIIIPDLVDKLEDPVDSDNALNGLCTLVSFKGRIVIPSLIPKLTYPTVNTKAFSKLAKVAGDILSRHLVSVLPALLQAVSNVIGKPNEQEEVENCCEVILAMNDVQATQIIVKDLITAISSTKSIEEQVAALKIMSGYIKGSKNAESLEDNKHLVNSIPLIMRTVLKLFLSDNRHVLLASFDCISDIMSSLGSNYIDYVKDIRDSILMIIREKSSKTINSNEEILIPGFCLIEKGIGPFIELYREALVNGRSELKEVAAGGMEDCISVTETDVLSKAAVKIAGPLIRTMAERHNSATKASIVSSLGKLVVKCPGQVKLFATQMQTIFSKCMADPSPNLRYKASIAQSKLAVIIAKPDQFFIDFVTREFSDENQYKGTGMEAVRFSLECAGNRLAGETLLKMIDILKRTISDKDDQIRVLSATCLGLTLSFLNFEHLNCIKSIFDKSTTSVLLAHGLAVTLITLLKSGSSKIFSNQCPSEMTDIIIKSLENSCNSDKVFICSAGYRALGFALVSLIKQQNTERLGQLLPLLINAMKNSSMEIKELVIDICGFLSWNDLNGKNVNLYAKSVLAVLINGYRAKENQLRINSEKRIIDLVHMSLTLKKRLTITDSPDQSEDRVYKTCCDSVEHATKSALQEIVIKYKKTVSSGTKEYATSCPELDNTYNKIINE